MSDNYLKKFGSRILTQLNGIKRPINVLSKEINIDESILNKCINGKLEESQMMEIVNILVNKYPLKISDLLLEKDNTIEGVVYFSNEESLKSKRTTYRKNKFNEDTEYYNYYDCAMNKYSPFKPELIEMLRIVSDNDPLNKDVAYNRGHLETQLTFYINKVNLYYEVNNIKYCIETNTGDSNIGIPYIPHTFTNRDELINSRIIC